MSTTYKATMIHKVCAMCNNDNNVKCRETYKTCFNYVERVQSLATKYRINRRWLCRMILRLINKRIDFLEKDIKCVEEKIISNNKKITDMI